MSSWLNVCGKIEIIIVRKRVEKYNRVQDPAKKEDINKSLLKFIQALWKMEMPKILQFENLPADYGIQKPIFDP